MKIFVVMQYYEECFGGEVTNFVGVFTTKELAENYIDKMIDPDDKTEDFEILERELDG